MAVAANEAARLDALRRYHILDTLPEESFDRIARLAQQFFGVPIAFVSLMDEDRQWFKSCMGTDLKETSREVSFCTYTIQGAEPMVVPDTHQDPRFADNPLVTGDFDLRFYAGAPLETPDGFNIGTLCLVDHEPRTLTAADQSSLADLAAMVMDELELRREMTERKQAEEAARHRARMEKTTATISEALLSSDPDLDVPLALMGKAVDANRSYLFEMRDGGRTLHNTHEWTAPGATPQIAHLQGLETERFPWWSRQIRQCDILPFTVSDLPEEARLLREILQQQGAQTLVDVPIRFSDGTLYGFVGFESQTASGHGTTRTCTCCAWWATCWPATTSANRPTWRCTSARSSTASRRKPLRMPSLLSTGTAPSITPIGRPSGSSGTP